MHDAGVNGTTRRPVNTIRRPPWLAPLRRPVAQGGGGGAWGDDIGVAAGVDDGGIMVSWQAERSSGSHTTRKARATRRL